MSAKTTPEGTLGEMLKHSRLSRGLSVRTAAKTAGITPMYLSLLERDACGPPSDEKLQSLAGVLFEQKVAELFAKAGRVTPVVVNAILRHPAEWSELIAAAKGLDADHLAGLKAILQSADSKQFLHFAAHGADVIAELRLPDEESQPKRKSKGKAGLPRNTKERTVTLKLECCSATPVKGE